MNSHTQRTDHVDEPPRATPVVHRPYGCLVAKGFDNMLVAGRNLSATHAAQASVRVAATCMAFGEAAGTAAALALHEHDDIRRFDVGLLRARLQTAGAILDPVVPAG